MDLLDLGGHRFRVGYILLILDELLLRRESVGFIRAAEGGVELHLGRIVGLGEPFVKLEELALDPAHLVLERFEFLGGRVLCLFFRFFVCKIGVRGPLC